MGIFGDIAGGLGGFIGGIAGNSAASDDQEQAKQNMLQAIATMKGVSVPEFSQMLAAGQAGSSAVGSMDPAGRNAQLGAINYMQDAASKGGYTLGDRVAQEQAMGKAAQYEQGQRGAIEQDMAARGQMGGGAGLAAKLSAMQGGANNAYQAGSSAAANAQMRALQEMQSAGSMGAGLQQNDQAAAQAKDLMERFNASQRAGAYQGQFADQMAKAGGLAQAYQGGSQYYNQDAQRQRNQYTGMGQGLGTAVGGAADAAKKETDPSSWWG
jgi:hypothetical protein